MGQALQSFALAESTTLLDVECKSLRRHLPVPLADAVALVWAGKTWALGAALVEFLTHVDSFPALSGEMGKRMAFQLVMFANSDCDANIVMSLNYIVRLAMGDIDDELEKWISKETGMSLS